MPNYEENLNKYGPGTTGQVKDLERMVAAANARPENKDIYEKNFRSIVSRPSKEIQNLAQEAGELANQYKREARGVEAPDSTIPKKILTTLGFKHGGKISTAEKHSGCKGW